MLEGLERRRLLSGNVQLSVFGGVGGGVYLTGDSKSNAVDIVAVEGGGYNVVGVGGTTINKQASVFIEAGPAIFNANMGGGDDVVQILGGSLSMPALTAIMGNGNDSVVVRGPRSP